MLKPNYFSLQEIVEHARTHSSFYRELYKGVPQSGWQLSDLPVLEQEAFWRANPSVGDNSVLTQYGDDGIVFKSGGTTGSPKHSVFTRSEWITMCKDLSEHIARAGMSDGDRVANLFYGGSLYASFLVTYHALMDTPTKIIQYPLAGAASDELVLETIREFNINVLMGIPATHMRLLDLIATQNDPSIKIDKLFFAGETLYEDQRKHARTIFPEIEFHSCGYASVDGGFVATADRDCGFNEHLSLPKTCILEIVDPDSGDVIEQTHTPGILVATNLARKQMPIIRYPLGDYGEWLEDVKKPTESRKFRLLGRSEAGARVGPATVYPTDITSILEMHSEHSGVSNFQLHITREKSLDKLTLVLAVREKPTNSELLEHAIISQLLEEKKLLVELIGQKKIHPISISWVSHNDIKANPRTGKCMRVVDDRLNS